MNRETKGKLYLIERLKRQVNLIRREEDSSQTRFLGVSIRNSPKTTIKKLILRIKTPQNIAASKGRDLFNNFVRNIEQRELVKCWECQGPHYAKYCSNQKGNTGNIHTAQEEETVGVVENEMYMINAVLKN